jgi:serine/threonine-protein kinase
MASPVREGDILAGKYKVERVLAQGGMGVVVAAMHQQLEQRVALKFLLPDGMENEATVGRFLREAKAAVRLRSEHVARVLDVGTAETGSPYIVMEYLEGKDLSGVLEEEGRLPIRSAVTYVLQAAEAVAEAHALGIVHRDLKPANLFLTKRADGTPCVKVLDFGISKLTTGADMNLTKTSAVMGTPFYMAPEQLQSSKNVDLRSDIWSLGMILYELCTGFVAFQRDTLPGLCSAILFEPVPLPRTLVPGMPEELEQVILKALEKKPEDRHQSLAVFATELASFVMGGEQLATRVRRVLGVEARPSDSPPDDPSSRELTSVPSILERKSPTPRSLSSPELASEQPMASTVAYTSRSPVLMTSDPAVLGASELFTSSSTEIAPPSKSRGAIVIVAISALLGIGVILAGVQLFGHARAVPEVRSVEVAQSAPTALAPSVAEIAAVKPESTQAKGLELSAPSPSAAPTTALTVPTAPSASIALRPQMGAPRPRPSAAVPSAVPSGYSTDLYGPRK